LLKGDFARDQWLKLDEKGKDKQPYAVAMADDAPMVMAGLWASWKDPASGNEIQSCTILTTNSNDAMGNLHNRMPVILAEKDWPTCVRVIGRKLLVHPIQIEYAIDLPD
jgi:putative SOS response-associated peptidase YedK